MNAFCQRHSPYCVFHLECIALLHVVKFAEIYSDQIPNDNRANVALVANVRLIEKHVTNCV